MKCMPAIALMVCCTCALAVVHAQGPMDQRGRPSDLPGYMFIETAAIPGSDSSLSRIDILYRIDREFFVPVRRNTKSSTSPFQRRGEVLVELFDSPGVSRARHIERVEIEDEGTPPLPHIKKWHEGTVTLTVAPGTYQLLLEATDLESQRKYFNDKMSVVARRFDGPLLLGGDIVFVEAQSPVDTLTADNYGGDVYFGSQRSAMVYLRNLDTTASVSVRYSVSVVTPGKPDTMLFYREDSAAFQIGRRWSYAAEVVNGRAVYVRSPQVDSSQSILLLPLSTAALPLRMFHLSLHIRNGSQEIHLEKNFRTVWPEMPLSLKDVDGALEVLKYVTTESQLDSLRKGSYDDRMKNLERFWKSKDQTPETATNDMMTEYYRRVDHAMREFATLRQPEGWRTDRGRIYILHGPPTAVDRTLDPSAGFREVWTYDRIMKRFTFVDRAKNGEYILLQGPKQ